jgi:hypothetical protein
MDAGQVAGLLVLVGVVGVLTAIVGSGIEAGPVRFPAIPGSRQKPLALASVLVVAGGISWWVVQQHGAANERAATGTSGAQTAPTSRLRVSLIPVSNAVHVGERLSVRAEVYDSRGQQLGSGQCRLDWSDAASSWKATTPCIATAVEPTATTPGVHHLTARAEGLGGLLARGSGAVDVAVGS